MNRAAYRHVLGSVSLLFLFFFAVTLICRVRVPADIDGLASLSAAHEWIITGHPTMNALGAEDWLLLPKGKMGSFGAASDPVDPSDQSGQPGQSGALYPKKGVTLTLLLIPLVMLARALPGASVLEVAALFNPLITAIIGVVLAVFITQLGASRRIAVGVAALWLFGTLALAYVKTLFGEPLAALLILIAVAAAWRAGTGSRQNAQLFAPLFISGLACALLPGINLAYFWLVLPIGGLAALRLHNLSRSGKLTATIAFVLPVVVMGLVIGGYNQWRFGGLLNSGYQFAAGEGFTTPLVFGLYGLLLSPYRGIVWFCPLVIPAAIGLNLWWRRERALIAVIVLIATGQALIFSMWWAWNGGIVWGPRFLLPVLPLIMIGLAPVLIWLVQPRRRVWRISFGVFSGLCVLISIAGVVPSYFPFIAYFNSKYTDTPDLAAISSITDSPIPGHIALLMNGYPSDLAVLSPWLVPVDRGGSSGANLAMTLDPPAVTVVGSTLFGSSLIDVQNVPVIALNAPTSPDDPRARRVWNYALHQASARGGLLWYVNWFAPNDPADWIGQDLHSQAGFIKQISAAEHTATLYFVPVQDVPMLTLDKIFGDGTTLIATGIKQDLPQNGSVNVVCVTTLWRNAIPDQMIARPFFIHALRPDNTIVAQQDRLINAVSNATSSTDSGTATQRDTACFYDPQAQITRFRVGLAASGQYAAEYIEVSSQAVADP